MKNLRLNLLKSAAFTFAMLFLTHGYSQAQWSTAGNVITTTEYLGANTNSTIPLQLKTIPALNIEFFTNNAQRLTIRGSNNITNWGNNTGYVGIGNSQPLSLLHLGNVNCYNGNFCAAPNNNTPAAGWRPWMITGTFMCGVSSFNSSDHLYVGIKNEANDRDHPVIVLSACCGDHSCLRSFC